MARMLSERWRLTLLVNLWRWHKPLGPAPLPNRVVDAFLAADGQQVAHLIPTFPELSHSIQSTRPTRTMAHHSTKLQIRPYHTHTMHHHPDPTIPCIIIQTPPYHTSSSRPHHTIHHHPDPTIPYIHHTIHHHPDPTIPYIIIHTSFHRNINTTAHHPTPPGRGSFLFCFADNPLCPHWSGARDC